MWGVEEIGLVAGFMRPASSDSVIESGLTPIVRLDDSEISMGDDEEGWL